MECNIQDCFSETDENLNYEIIKELLCDGNSTCKKFTSIIPKGSFSQDSNDKYLTYLLIGSYIVCLIVNDNTFGKTISELNLYSVYEIRKHIHIVVCDEYITAELTDNLKFTSSHKDKSNLYDFIKSILSAT